MTNRVDNLSVQIETDCGKHTTMLYVTTKPGEALKSFEIKRIVQELVAELVTFRSGPFDASVAGIGYIGKNSLSCYFIESSLLSTLRRKLERIPTGNLQPVHPGFLPHITDESALECPEGVNIVFTFTHLRVSYQKGGESWQDILRYQL